MHAGRGGRGRMSTGIRSQGRRRRRSTSELVEPEAKIPREEEKEDDQHRLEQREKQIVFGKNTIGYQRYVNEISRNERKPGMPVTPDKYKKYSKRRWDGIMKQWRRSLHEWDTDEKEEKKEYADGVDDDDGQDYEEPVFFSDEIEEDGDIGDWYNSDDEAETEKLMREQAEKDEILLSSP